MAVSVMLAIRLGAGGAQRGEIVRILVELWAAYGLAALLLAAISRLTGESQASGVEAETADFMMRLTGLDRSYQALFFVGLALSIGLVVHLLYSLRGAMRKYPLG